MVAMAWGCWSWDAGASQSVSSVSPNWLYRSLDVEHRVLPYVVKLFAEGRVRVDGRNVLLADLLPS